MYRKAQLGIQHSGVRGGIVVTDNDSSANRGKAWGARCTHRAQGYGNACAGTSGPHQEKGLS